MKRLEEYLRERFSFEDNWRGNCGQNAKHNVELLGENRKKLDKTT